MKKLLVLRLVTDIDLIILTLMLILYRTSWKDRFVSDGVRVNGVNGSANYYGIEQIHTGIEFDGVLEISPFVKVEGMLSLGNYEYGSDVTADVFNTSQELIGTSTVYLDGVKVGDAAQTTSRVNLVVTPSDCYLNSTYKHV